jgi:hypothetical protein
LIPKRIYSYLQSFQLLLLLLLLAKALALSDSSAAEDDRLPGLGQGLLLHRHRNPLLQAPIFDIAVCFLATLNPWAQVGLYFVKLGVPYEYERVLQIDARSTFTFRESFVFLLAAAGFPSLCLTILLFSAAAADAAAIKLVFEGPSVRLCVAVS